MTVLRGGSVHVLAMEADEDFAFVAYAEFRGDYLRCGA
jgi:hypothetical protein